jgi:hypothetical protein
MEISNLPFGIYAFNIRTITNCGPGPFSDVLVVQQQFAPAQMAPVSSIIDGCDVKFSWNPTNNGGLPIIDYILEVQAFNNGEY